jgi:hypothetical protein
MSEMLLFQPEHVQPILDGTKTETRRDWGERSRVLVGSIQQCKLGKDMYKKDSFFAKIRILDVHQERLGIISLDSCQREGYDSVEAFKAVWTKINKTWNPDLSVYVVRFEVAT